jgi:hypothetical protein
LLLLLSTVPQAPTSAHLKFSILQDILKSLKYEELKTKISYFGIGFSKFFCSIKYLLLFIILISDEFMLEFWASFYIVVSVADPGCLFQILITSKKNFVAKNTKNYSTFYPKICH